jgi:serine-type D-Ala-D-Ala carboxypeptidase (penicillin-binding protein 5/6)
LRLLAVAIATAALAAGSAVPWAAAGADTPPRIQASAWLLVDARTGEALARQAPDRRLPMASTTKMMTAYLALRRLRMDDIVPAAGYRAIPGESLMGTRAGQEVSVRDLLYGLILLSGNDAAVTLAVAVSGTVPRFVRLMNRTARRLGLDDTSYENPIGLDGADQFSSAADLVALSRILMKDPRFRAVAGARTATLRSYSPPIEIETGNEFVRDVPWAKGIKTGYTSLSGYVLASDGRRKATELIAVVMGTSSEAARDAETVELMDYGFSLYEKRVPIRSGKRIARVPVRFEDQGLAVSSPVSVRIGVKEGENLTVTFDLPDEVEGPIARGDRIGNATVRLDGELIRSAPLFADRDVTEPGRLDRALALFSPNPVYTGIALLVILALAALYRRHQERAMRNRLIRTGRRQR